MHVRSLWWYGGSWIGAGGTGGGKPPRGEQGLSKLNVNGLNQRGAEEDV